MAGIGTQIFEQLSHLPSDVERPIPGTILLSLGALSVKWFRDQFKKTETAYAADMPNSSELIQSIKEVKGEAAVSDLQGNRKARTMPIVAMLAGLSIGTGAAVAEPTFETSRVNAEANAVAVEGRDYSMNKTFDLGNPNISRAEAVDRGIKMSHYSGRLAVVQEGNSSSTILPLSANWRSHTNVLSQQQVDPNGNNTLQALQLAESILPLGAKADTRDGTVDVFSDSVVDADPSAIKTQVKKMQHEGITVRFVVPGSAGGSYQVSRYDKPTSAAPNPANFGGSGAEVESTQTVASTEKAVASTIQAAGVEDQKHPWLPISVLGFAVALGGLAANVRNTAKRLT